MSTKATLAISTCLLAAAALAATTALFGDPMAPAPAAGSAPAPAPGVWESGKFSLVPRAFQSSPHIDVMIVTEFTKAGRAAPQAGGDHPIYYTGSDGGLVGVGEVIAGEQVPEASVLARILTESLQVGGFLPTDAAHPPDIFIHYRWGSFNRLAPLGRERDDLDFANWVERAALVGGTKFAMQMAQAYNAGTLSFFENQSPRTNFLMSEIRNNQYFLIASAYDYAAAKEGKALLLWRTKLSTSSRGITMDESLPQMVASSGPYFGHETNGPVRLNRPVVKDGKVTIGTPTIMEDLPSATPNPPPATQTAPEMPANP